MDFGVVQPAVVAVATTSSSGRWVLGAAPPRLTAPLSVALAGCLPAGDAVFDVDADVLLGRDDACIEEEVSASSGSGGTASAALAPDVLDPLDRVDARSTWERKVHARMADHVVLRPLGADRTTLVVVLHGSGGRVENVALIQEAAAASGYSTVALSWYVDGGEPPVLACGHATTEDAWNDCLGVERAERFDVIACELADVLLDLMKRYPAEGWERFVDGEAGRPLWPAIAFAGYSDGANEVGFILRVPGVALRGAVLVSGGGDCGSLEACSVESPRSADWVEAPVSGTEPCRLMGLWHAEEPNAELLHLGWDAVGMPDTRADALAVSAADVTMAAVLGVHRLRDTGPGGHAALLSHDDLFPALMYATFVAGQ